MSCFICGLINQLVIAALVKKWANQGNKAGNKKAGGLTLAGNMLMLVSHIAFRL